MKEFSAFFALMRDVLHADQVLADPRLSSYDIHAGEMQFSCTQDCNEAFVKARTKSFITKLQEIECETKREMAWNMTNQYVQGGKLQQSILDNYRQKYDIPSTVTLPNLTPLDGLKVRHPLTDRLLTWLYQHDLARDENLVFKEVNAIIDVIEKYKKSLSPASPRHSKTQLYKESIEGAVTALVKNALVADPRHRSTQVIAELMGFLDSIPPARGHAGDSRQV